ncbi:MAG: serine proteinase [Lawsonibacter sp.]
MGFFDSFKEKATDLAQAGVAQSKRLAEIAKLKTANLGEEDTIKKAYVELGKLYYAEKGMAPEGAYAAACEKITAAKAAIEVNNERIAELKDSGEAETEEVIQADPVAEEPAEEHSAEKDPVSEEPKAEE